MKEISVSSRDLIRELRPRGRRVAIVTSSKNCDAVLEVAGIRDLFDARVEGKVAEEKKLAGKPAPRPTRKPPGCSGRSRNGPS